MRLPLSIAAVAALAVEAFAETNSFERYEVILERQMFGPTPPGFDPTKPPTEASKAEQRELTKEQEVLKSAIRFSMINVTPDGATTVGFSDNADPKHPVAYYLKVGEEKNGWKVLEADPVKATMTIVKDDVEVSLELGASSGKGGGKGAAGAAGAMGANGLAAGQRAGLLRRGPGGLGGNGFGGGGSDVGTGGGRLDSMRKRREALAAERAEQAAKEKAQLDAAREEQRKELQLLKDELKAQRDAMEKEKAEREAQTELLRQERARQAESNANDDN